jgi:hypothetical protein
LIRQHIFWKLFTLTEGTEKELCFLCVLLFKNSCVQRYMEKKEEMPVMKQKPGL